MKIAMTARPHMAVTQREKEKENEEVRNLNRWMRIEWLRLDHLKIEGVRVLER